MCTDVLPAGISVYYLYAQCPYRLEEGVRSPGTRVTEGGSCHVGLLEEQW